MDSWWLCPRPVFGAALRLFCLPYAGGGTSVFRRWFKSLGHGIEVVALQLPGRENRLGQRPLSSLSRLVAALREAILPRLDLPYAFFGHSLGALVGFELARELRRVGAPQPEALFVAGQEAPRIPDPGPLLHVMPDAEFVAELARRYRPIPEDLLDEPELLELLLASLRADLEMTETYVYAADEPLECPLFVFGGRQDPRIGWQELEPWCLETTGPCNVRMFEGDHFFFESKSSPVAGVVAEELSRLLDEIPAGASRTVEELVL